MSRAPVARRREFAAQMPPARARALPYLSVLLGSLVTLVPTVAPLPLLPPFGLLMLLGWRSLRPGMIPVWAPLPLGLFDDLFSGQPLGSAMLNWTLAFILLELVDQRLQFRDFRQDWGIAAIGIALVLAGGRLLASPIASAVDAPLLGQILASIAVFPLAVRLCAWLDRFRGWA